MPRAPVLVAVCLLVLLGIGLRLQQLHTAATGEAGHSAGTPEDEALFHELLDAGLLSPRADGGLERLPPDWLMQRAASAQESGAPDSPSEAQALEEQRRLLGALDHSAVGAIVEQQIELWNETRNLSAIRDNGVPGEEGTPFAWSAQGARGRPLSTGRLVPETFGFVHDGVLRAGYSDWLAIPGSSGPVTFRSIVTPANSGPVTLQLIGTPLRLPPGARSKKLAGIVQEGCPEQPVAHLISLPRFAKATRVEITALPSINCAARIHGLAIRLDEPEVTSAAPARYRFRPVRRGKPSGRYVIRTRDGKFLSDPAGHGRPSAATRRLGLLPLVGTGGGDSFSLSGMLAASKLPLDTLDVQLTIDSKIQDAAQEALSWGASRYGDDPWASQRKAALVILDAESGAILAVAGHPVIPESLTDWDLPAFSAAFPLRDPSSVLAWEVIDKHNTPGSTFKPVTALSLMMDGDAAFRERIRPVLFGLDSANLRRATGLSFESTSYVAYGGAKPVPNFGGASLGRYAERAGRDKRCVAGDAEASARAQQQKGRFGLAKATQFSINAWFARVALMMEQARIDDFAARVDVQEGERIPAPEMTLTRTARWLGIHDRQRLDLAANVPAAAGLRRYSGESHDVLYPQLARSTLAGMAYNQNDWGARPLVMYTAALNGIGQTISASPLHMSLVAAAIASGRRVSPHLIAAWNGKDLPTSPGDPLPVEPGLLELLREGMKGVTEAGTAARVFPRPLACRVYGKTGTAEIDAARSYNSGWFIGWREPGRPGERTLAFACMTTHATGNYRFGGTACAPVVSRALQALEAEAGEELAAQ